MRPQPGSVRGEDPGHGLHVPKDLGDLAELLFEWPIRQAPRLALPGCILIAAFIQASMIFLFSISYKNPSDIPPSSPQIYFLPTDSAAARKIAPWLEANDPAVFSPLYATQTALPAPPPLKYRPSYEEPPPPLRLLPAEPARSLLPPSLPLTPAMLQKSLSSRLPATSLAPATNAPLPQQQTLVQWQDGLASRVLLAQAANRMTTAPQPLAASAQPALYEVGIGAEGMPMHCVLLDSSGDSASDEAGSVWIHAQRFSPSTQESWGRVLILWGTPQALPSTPPQHP